MQVLSIGKNINVCNDIYSFSLKKPPKNYHLAKKIGLKCTLNYQNMAITLTKQQKEVLRLLKETRDIFIVLDELELEESEIEFWRKTNFKFDKEYLKGIGITRLQERFLNVFPLKMLNISATCKAVGIHRSTYYDWVYKSDTFNTFLRDTREGLFDDIETLIYKMALEGNTRMLIFIAKTKMRNRGYGDTIVTRSINNNLNTDQDMTLEEIEEEIRKLEEKYG